MQTYQTFGIPNARDLGERPIASQRNLYLNSSGQFYLHSLTGDGSTIFSTDDFQSIYLDNLANDVPLKITATGTLISFKVPAFSEAWLPITCPLGSFGFLAEGKANAEISCTLFNCFIPALVKKGIPSNAWLDENYQPYTDENNSIYTAE